MLQTTNWTWVGTKLSVLFLLPWLAGCSQSDTVTLGATVQLTGPLASTGRVYRDAYQLAVATINEKGGVALGDLRYKLALKLFDNESDPTISVQQHGQLITKDRVNFLLGPYTSREVLAGALVAQQYQIPMVQAGGASSRIFTRGNRYVFGMLPPAEDYFRSTIAMLQQLTPDAKTVGLIMGDDPFDTSVANGTLASLKEAGFEVVLQQQYSERTPNFFNILTLVRARSPDVILWVGHEAGAISFIRQMKSRNISAKLMASFTVAVSGANFRSELGKDANYAFGMTPWLPSDRHKDRWFGDAAQFAKIYEEKFGYAPGYHAAAAVAAVETLVLGMEAARTFDSEYVRDAIAKLDFDSVFGRIRFGDTGQISMPQTVIQLQNGKVVEVFTDKLINQPLYPVPPWDGR